MKSLEVGSAPRCCSRIWKVWICQKDWLHRSHRAEKRRQDRGSHGRPYSVGGSFSARVQGPQRKYAGYLSTTWSRRCQAAGTAGWSERWWGKRWSEWRSQRDQKQRSQCAWIMKMTMGWMETQTWATVCVHLNKENSQGTTLIDNMEERLRKRRIFNAWWHAVASTTLTDSPSVSGYFTHCWAFRSVHRSSIQFVDVPLYSISDLYANSLWRFTLRKRVLWGVVFTPPVGCSRPPSVVNDPTATKWERIVKVARLRFDLKTAKNRFPVLSCRFVVARVRTFIWIIMSSTKNRSTATNWRKNSMIGASIDTSRMALARVVVLQILGVDGAMWTTPRWSQNDFSIVQMFCHYWEKSANSFCIEIVLLALYDVWNLSAQASSILIQTSSSRSCSSWDARNSGSLENAFWRISFSNYGQHNALFVL